MSCLDLECTVRANQQQHYQVTRITKPVPRITNQVTRITKPRITNQVTRITKPRITNQETRITKPVSRITIPYLYLR